MRVVERSAYGGGSARVLGVLSGGFFAAVGLGVPALVVMGYLQADVVTWLVLAPLSAVFFLGGLNGIRKALTEDDFVLVITSHDD